MSDIAAGEHKPSATAPHVDEAGAGFDTVLVLDFGAQYGQLIARRVRECRVYSQLVPHDISVDEIKARAPKGLIFSGGPMSVYVDGAPRPDPRLYELGIPDPRHLLRRPAHGAAARRHGGQDRACASSARLSCASSRTGCSSTVSPTRSSAG